MSEITVNISSLGNRWAIKNIMQPAIMPKFNIALISSYVFVSGNRSKAWPQTLLSFGITGNRWGPLCSQGSGDVLHYSATLFAKKWYHIALFWLCCVSFSYTFLCQIVVTPLVLLTCHRYRPCLNWIRLKLKFTEWSQWREVKLKPMTSLNWIFDCYSSWFSDWELFCTQEYGKTRHTAGSRLRSKFLY